MYPILPDTEKALELHLGDKTWCEHYFLSVRWPDSLTCIFCGQDTIRLLQSGAIKCSACGRITSLTAGTLLHGTKKNISWWLRGIWLLISTDQNITVKVLQSKLGLRNYRTARHLMTKFQRLKHHFNSTAKCSGIITIEDTPIRLKKENRYCHVLAIQELKLKNYIFGRLHLIPCKEISLQSLEGVLSETVVKGATILLPNREPYRRFVPLHYLVIFKRQDFEQHDLDTLLDTLQTSRKNGSATFFSHKRLQQRCTDLCFDYNRRFYPGNLTLFSKFVTCLTHSNRHEAIEKTVTLTNGDRR